MTETSGRAPQSIRSPRLPLSRCITFLAVPAPVRTGAAALLAVVTPCHRLLLTPTRQGFKAPLASSLWGLSRLQRTRCRWSTGCRDNLNFKGSRRRSTWVVSPCPPCISPSNMHSCRTNPPTRDFSLHLSSCRRFCARCSNTRGSRSFNNTHNRNRSRSRKCSPPPNRSSKSSSSSSRRSGGNSVRRRRRNPGGRRADRV
mmetsp:Transcript_7633/g.22594  ORF Transcript_7633/g.22594 Transcript_7633/m.22594 type:complete len:200 (-) Transcript_7633:4236-4835(-)